MHLESHSLTVEELSHLQWLSKLSTMLRYHPFFFYQSLTYFFAPVLPPTIISLTFLLDHSHHSNMFYIFLNQQIHRQSRSITLIPLNSSSWWFIEKAREFQQNIFLLYWLCQSLWLYGSQQTVGNSERDGNTRPPDLPPEKPIYSSGSNS